MIGRITGLLFLGIISAAAAAPAIPGADAFIPVPGGAVAPDKTHTYRAIFDARQPAAKPGDILPAIMMAGDELNTLAASRVPLAKADFAIIFHTTEADLAVLDNAQYRKRYGRDNPNLAMLSRLRKAGVKLFVCAQQLAADNVPLKQVSPDVTVAVDGLVVLMTYQNQGYALLSF